MPARQQKVSRRYYGFEDTLWNMPGFAHLKRRRPLAELQLLAGFVWARERGDNKCPAVKAKNTNDYSYYCEGSIHLARKHRSAGGLLHEIAHALGHRDKLTHGPAFQKRCLRLYRLYGEWNGRVDEEA